MISRYKAKLAAAKMDIYRPSAAEAREWQSRGESVWQTEAKDIDKLVIDRMLALR